MITYNVIAQYNNGMDARHYYKYDVAKRIYDSWKASGEYYHVLFTVTGKNVMDVDIIAEYREG